MNQKQEHAALSVVRELIEAKGAQPRSKILNELIDQVQGCNNIHDAEKYATYALGEFRKIGILWEDEMDGDPFYDLTWKRKPKRHPSLPKGGKLPDGSPAKVANPKRNAGIALSSELLDAIANLPQIQSREWSKSYLFEQMARNWLNLPTDYNQTDLALIAEGKIVE